MRYVFSSSNSFWQSSIHSKVFFSILKNDRHLSVALETNLLKATTLPLRLCTSLAFFGGAISSMARILLRLASMPCFDTMKPRNFPNDTLNAHLPGLNFPANHQDGCFPLLSLQACRPHIL